MWAVFDRDEPPEFEQAVQLCEPSGLCVARSNPRFELWLILHDRDYNRSNRRLSVQADLKGLRPEYDPKRATTPDCDELVRRVENAEKRAAAQLRDREPNGDSHGNPSTAMGNSRDPPGCLAKPGTWRWRRMASMRYSFALRV